MEDDILYKKLCNVLGDNMSPTEIESFISFLRACGAYNEYIKEINLERLKSFFEKICYGDFYNFLYNIIASSFAWHETDKGFQYWRIIQNLHRLILNIKCKCNLIENCEELNAFFSSKLITDEDFQELKNQSLLCCEQERQLIYFINGLKWQLKNNKLIH